MKGRLLAVLTLGLLVLVAGCGTDEVTGPTQAVAVPTPTPDPCACHHGEMVVKKNGKPTIKISPYEEVQAVVTAWINTQGEAIEQGKCPSPGMHIWSASGGGCTFPGVQSQSTATLWCTRPTIDTDPARIEARLTNGCMADYKLNVGWD